MAPQPFNVNAKSMSIAVIGSASASTPLPATGNVLRAVNPGTGDAYIAVGPDAQAAIVATGTPSNSATIIPAGKERNFSIPSDAIQNISAISPTTTTLIVQVGEGSN